MAQGTTFFTENSAGRNIGLTRESAKQRGGDAINLKYETVVCIPAYNEERTIASVIVRAKKYSDAIIVCDDGSSDMTAEIAEQLGAIVIRNGRNIGKGASLRKLMLEAMRMHASIVVTIDADMQHDPEEIPKPIEPIRKGEAELVIGARMMEGNAPSGGIIGNKLLDAVINAKTGERIKDTQSGFRAYSSSAFKKIEFIEKGLLIESQTLIDAVKAGVKVIEVPVSTTYKGVRRKRSALNHLAEIVDYLLARTVVESPVLYLGLPGLAALVVGLIAAFRVLSIFLSSHQIAIGTGLISVILIIAGTIMIATSIILKFLDARPRV